MTRTVHELRNAIRLAVGRFERESATGFTKESLAAIGEAVGAAVDDAGRLPPKAELRAGIRERVDGLDADPESAGRSFRKAELETIADAVGAE